MVASVRNKRFIAAAGLLSAFLISLSFSQIHVRAIDSNTTAAEGLQISPALVELNAERGKSYLVQVQVLNVTANNLLFNATVNDFSSKNETGTPSIVLDKSTPLATSIRTWIDPLPSFNLAPREVKKIDATVTIPSDAEPGGHYGVIRFAGNPPELESSGVGATVSAGTLVLVRVAGNITESLKLATFEASKNGTPSSAFESGPITFVERFQNSGTVHVKPIGQIEIRDTFGNVVDTLTVNPTKGNVLPGSVRRFESTLDKPWLFGHYTADISISYGTTGQAIVQTLSFWIIPYKLLLVGLFVLVTVVFILKTLIKRYNSYIIKKANAQNTANDKKAKQKKK